MADENTTRETQSKFRNIVADVVGELRGEEIARSFASISIEEVVDQHIAELTEARNQTSVSRLARVEHVYNQLVENIEELKEMSPEEFDARDPSNEVNTPPEGS